MAIVGTGHTHQKSDISERQARAAVNRFADPQGRFEIVSASNEDARRFLRMDPYSAATAFIDGKFTIEGDIIAAIRFFSCQQHWTLRHFLFSLAARMEHLRIHFRLGARNPAAESIQFHYDRSNEFYEQFLDPRMQYSSAYFSDSSQTLEEAQLQKLERICRDLQLEASDRFLDIGCGWGGLITYAAERFGVTTMGCTLSKQQLAFARELVRKKGLTDRVRIELMDYRDLTGQFDKVTSVGMFEHVGRARLAGYFQKVYSLLDKGGLFLNRGVVRPEGVSDSPETLFIQKSVFPGGELVHLSDVVQEGKHTGFELIGTEQFGQHYAMTCERWVRNLERSADACRSIVSERTYRTWLLYLAGSAVSFQNGKTGAAQAVFRK